MEPFATEIRQNDEREAGMTEMRMLLLWMIYNGGVCASFRGQVRGVLV